MADSPVLHALRDKRAEITGAIMQKQGEIRRLHADLAALDQTIKLLYPKEDLRMVKPKRIEFTPHTSPGTIARLVVNALRESDEPMSVAELALLVTRATGGDAENLKRLRSLRQTVARLLRRYKGKGFAVDREKGGVVRWSLA